MIGKANNNCEAISGGVNTAAIAKATTIKQRLNFFNFSSETTFMDANKVTATGTSKVAPKAINICNTKLKYESMSGAKLIASGLKEAIKVKRKPKTTKQQYKTPIPNIKSVENTKGKAL